MIRTRADIGRAERWWAWLPAWARALLTVIGCVGAGKVALQVYYQLKPTITPPQVGFLLDSRWRRWYRAASGTLPALALRDGLRVLEVGGGVGTFTVPLAERVAPAGGVYSVELQTGMLKQQLRAVRRSGLPNIWLHQADALQLPFADASFDRAVLIAVLPMLRDKRRGLQELRRVLKADGLLAVSEDLVEPEYVPVPVTRRWCRQAGFEEVAIYHDGLCYTAVFHIVPAGTPRPDGEVNMAAAEPVVRGVGKEAGATRHAGTGRAEWGGRRAGGHRSDDRGDGRAV